jgi:hypothetical protein
MGKKNDAGGARAPARCKHVTISLEVELLEKLRAETRATGTPYSRIIAKLVRDNVK